MTLGQLLDKATSGVSPIIIPIDDAHALLECRSFDGLVDRWVMNKLVSLGYTISYDFIDRNVEIRKK